MDRRVIRTIKRIKREFLNILQDEDFNQITVKMICEAADIERKTFYLHFKDKYDLLSNIIEEKLDAFRPKVNQDPHLKLVDFYYAALNFFDDHRNILFHLLNEKGPFLVRKKFASYILKRLKRLYGDSQSSATMYFVAYGVGGVFEAYISGNIKEGKYEIAQEIVDLVMQAHKEFEK